MHRRPDRICFCHVLRRRAAEEGVGGRGEAEREAEAFLEDIAGAAQVRVGGAGLEDVGQHHQQPGHNRQEDADHRERTLHPVNRDPRAGVREDAQERPGRKRRDGHSERRPTGGLRERLRHHRGGLGHRRDGVAFLPRPPGVEPLLDPSQAGNVHRAVEPAGDRCGGQFSGLERLAQTTRESVQHRIRRVGQEGT